MLFRASYFVAGLICGSLEGTILDIGTQCINLMEPL
jgi:hypothetical protein